jgi:phage tail sheath gpL-like
MISFSMIPTDVRVPGAYVEFDASKALSGLPPAPQKILVIGQRTAAGIVPALTPTRILSRDEAIQNFGRGSQLAAMCSALKAVNDRTEAWAIALDDLLAGTAATKTITFTGPATGAGTLALLIAGVKVPVAVTNAETATQIATAVAAAVNANLDLPVTAGSALGVVTLTARHKGTTGNDIDVRVNHYQGELLPAGITVAVAAGVAGAGNPDIATVFATIADEAFQTIILPFTDAATLDAVDTELEARSGPMRMVEGMAFGARSDTLGNLLNFGATRNGKYVSIMGGKGLPTPPYAIAAAYGAQVAYYGGIDPARPFQTLPLPGVLAPKMTDRFSQSERENLLRDGISTFKVDAGGTVLIERAITTYQVNSQNLEDISFLDVNTPLTLFYLRIAVRSRISLRFPRCKLAGDNARVAPGQAIVRPKDIRAELIALFRDLEDAGLVEDIDQFKNDLIVERNPSDPSRIDALIPPNIVNQFRVFAGRVEFRL